MYFRAAFFGMLCLVPGIFHAQGPVQGSLTASKARLEIVDAFPDSFPLVDLIFRAVDSLGTPFWDLRRDQVQVAEDGRPCEVICLVPITYPEPIDVSLVLDHSGSMGVQAIFERDTALYLRFWLDSAGYKAFVDTAITPLTYAKAGVIDFAKSFDPNKDRIAFTGFASTVGQQLALTGDTAGLIELVHGLSATTSTALFDAVIAGLGQLDDANRLRVLVVLTDGMDNASTAGLGDAVQLARRMEVPVYAIGIGNAWRPVLDSLTLLSGGKAFYTEDATTLSQIYTQISKEVQAYYELTYRSANLASQDTTRDVSMTVDFGEFQLKAGATARLPEEVIALLEQKERERMWVWAGGVLLAMAAGAAITYVFRRKRHPIVERVWPVPATTELYMLFSEPGVNVQFRHVSQGFSMNMRGTTGVNRYDISGWPSGAFVITVLAAGREPEVQRFVKQ